MTQTSRLVLEIDSRTAEERAEDMRRALTALDGAGLRASNSVTGVGRSALDAGRQSSQGSRGVDQINKSLSQTDEAGNAALATLRRFALQAAAGYSVVGLVDMADSYGQMASRIRQATQSQEEYEFVQQRLQTSARETYRNLGEAQELFVRTTGAIRDMGYELGQSIDLTDSFSLLMVTNSTSVERGANAIQAYSKAIQTNRLDSEGWQTIMTAIPSVVEQIAESTGKTMTEVRKLGIEGKLSIQDFNKALLDGNETFRAQAAAMPVTVRDALQNLSNSFQSYIGYQNETIGVTAAMSGAIDVLGTNFETLADVVGVIAAGALARYAVVTAQSTAATIASYMEKRTAALAELALAQAQSRQTAATLAQVTALRGLGASHQQVTAATLAHEAATARLTAAQGAAAGIGRAVLGVMGGPVGLGVTALAAAAAIWSVRDSSEDAGQALIDLKQPIDNVRESFAALTRDQQGAELVRATKEQTAAVKEQETAYSDLLGLVRQDLGSSVFARIKSDFDEAAASGRPLTEVIQDIGTRFKIPQDSINSWVEQAGKTSTAQQVVEAITQRIAVLTAETEANTASTMANNAVREGMTSAGEKYNEALQKQLTTLQDNGSAVKAANRFIEQNRDLTESDRAAILSSAAALDSQRELTKKLTEAKKEGAKETQKQESEVAKLTKALHEQAATLSMSESELIRYKFEQAGATAEQTKAAEGMFAEISLRKEVAKAVKIHTDTLKQQRAVEAELQVFRQQQELQVTGVGMGDVRRQQLEAEYQIRREYAERQRQLEEAQLVESTRMSQTAYESTTESLRIAEEQKIQILRDSAQQKIMAEQDWTNGATRAIENYMAQARNVASQTESMFTGVFSSMQSAGGAAFEAMIFDSQSLGDSVQQVAEAMLRSFINSLGQMLMQWAAYQAMQLLLGKTTQASAASALAANAQATSLQAGLAAFASTAAIPIVGPVAAPAAMAAALAVTNPLAAAVGMTALAGMAHEGIDSIPKTGTWLLEKGERVTTAKTSAKLDKQLDNMGSGGGKVIIYNYANNSEVTTEEKRNSDGEVDTIVMIRNVERALAGNMRSGTGELHGATAEAFGLIPQPAGRNWD